MSKKERRLGDEYALLKSKNKKIILEMWHTIFNFFSNEDDPPKKIIFNDFLIFCNASELGLNPHEVNKLYNKMANTNWNSYLSLSLNEFSLSVEAIASEIYDTKYSA